MPIEFFPQCLKNDKIHIQKEDKKLIQELCLVAFVKILQGPPCFCQNSTGLLP